MHKHRVTVFGQLPTVRNRLRKLSDGRATWQATLGQLPPFTWRSPVLARRQPVGMRTRFDYLAAARIFSHLNGSKARDDIFKPGLKCQEISFWYFTLP